MNRKKFFCIFSTFLVLFLSGVAFGFDTFSTIPLIRNTPVSREFKTNDRHSFVITAKENEAVEIICERLNADLELTVFTPTGEKILTSNAPDGFAGFDKLLFIAEKTGEYQIKIESRRPGKISGNYTITLKRESQASENDVMCAAAAKLSGSARETLSGAENRFEKAKQTLEKLEKAFALYEKAADLQGQAETLFHIATINGAELGNKAESIENYEKALLIWSKLDDEAGRAICLTYLAGEIRDFDSTDKPRSFYTEKARKYFDEALAINRKLGDTMDEAAALASLCRFYNDTGVFQKGFEACRESLRLTGGNDPLTDYQTYGNLASLSGNSGDFENAVKYNRIALEHIEIVKNLINPYRKAFIKSNLGNLLASLKDYDEAETELREALKITEEVKRDFYSGYILVRLGSILYQRNRLPEALDAAQKAVDYYRRLDPVKIQAALNVLGKIQLELNQTETARSLFTEAVELNRQNQDRYAEAESLYNLARLENQAENLEIAHQHIDVAISLSEVIRAQLLGKNQRTTYLSILKKYYELEIELLVKLQNKTAQDDYAEQAWQRHERIRARSLMENLIESGLNLNEFAPPDFYTQEQALLEAIAAAEIKRSEALKAKNAALQKAAETLLNQKLDEYDVLQENFRKKNPQFSAVNQPKNFTIADAQKMLENDAAIIEYALCERQSFVWVIRKNSFRLVALPSKQNLEKSVREFYVALTDRNTKDDKTIIEKSKNLSREILSPIAEDLKNINQAVVIADGALQIIPFSALTLTPETENFDPLAAKINIVNAPSFASLVFLRENKANRQKDAAKTLAVFADPIFQEDDERFSVVKPTNPKSSSKNVQENLAKVLRDFNIERLARLPFSGIEAREIEKLSPQQTFLALGADASRKTFLNGDFNSYSILHFATHGFLNQQNPDLSGLVLSLYDENRNVQNGFLRVIDLYSMRLNSDLVVLSACQTALGKEIDGEGIVGLTRGFMYAGASGVVSSLWKVEDAATAELMKQFYTAMLKEKQTPSAALRTAQNSLRNSRRFSNPRFWAGFTLNGEWQR